MFLAATEFLSPNMMLSLAATLAGLASLLGVALHRVKLIENRVAKSDEIAPVLAQAIDSLAVVTGKIIDWESAKTKRLDDTERRSRANRERIAEIERDRHRGIARRLRESGAPSELIEEVDGALDSKEWELSSEIAVPSKKVRQ